jgi:hypothetical protein
VSVWSLLEGAAKFHQFSRNMEFATEGILTEWAVAVQKRAKESLGHYQKGWPDLAASTLRKKNDDTPLLETGALRDSIGAKVIMHGKEHGVAYVGTDDMHGVWAELGTRHEPPRPFLLSAALHKKSDIDTIARKWVRSAWISAGRDNEVLHLLHAIRLLIEVAKEATKSYRRDMGFK